MHTEQRLRILVNRFHDLLGINKNDINTDKMTEKNLCDELGKCISDIEYDYLAKFPTYNQAFSYWTHERGYKCALCQKCFVAKDEAEMHFRFEHRDRI